MKVNWIEDTHRSLTANFPELRAANSVYLTVRLSKTLISRLPPDIVESLFELLPTPSEELKAAILERPDLSIGYPEFVEQASRSLIEPVDPDLLSSTPDFFDQLADAFLWAFAQQIPADLKKRISENLPVDLRTRMNLYTASVEDAKVA